LGSMGIRGVSSFVTQIPDFRRAEGGRKKLLLNKMREGSREGEVRKGEVWIRSP